MEDVIVIHWPFMFNDDEGFGPFWTFGWHIEGGYYDSGYAVCDAFGWRVFEVLSRHKPSPAHMERVFCRERVFDPLGRPFGGIKTRVLTKRKFDLYASGQNYLPVDVEIQDGGASSRYALIEPYITHDEKLSRAIITHDAKPLAGGVA